MRSFSIHVGRLFGVEVRLHLTFLILPLFVFWTEYNANHPANGPRDLALVGIVLACVAAHELPAHARGAALRTDSEGGHSAAARRRNCV
jgi:hypothetical protein